MPTSTMDWVRNGKTSCKRLPTIKPKMICPKYLRYLFYYCPLNFWVRYKFRADTSHEVSALFVIFAFVPKLR